MNNKYIAGIDGLRAVAVILVVLFHAGFTQFSGGYVGVDVFFVISGFLITRLIVDEIHSSGTFDFGRFYYRRARRLFPAMFATVAITSILAVLLFTPQHLKRFGGEVIYSIFSLSNFFFLTESGYFNTSADFKPLLHTWSLSVEEQYYMIWPATLYLAYKLGRHKAILLTIAALFILSILLNLSFSDGKSFLTIPFGQAITQWLSDGAATIYFFTPMRAFEFCIGAALVFIRRQTINGTCSDVIMAIGLALIAYATFAFDENTLFPSYNALIPCLGTAAVILCCDSPRTGAIIRSRPFVFTGLISYSVYLVHWPIIVFTKYWLMRDLFIYEKFLLVIASIIFGYALYKLVETPFRRSSATDRKSQFGLACMTLAMLLLLPASTVWSSDGWKWRLDTLPPEVEKQLANSKQFHVDQYGGAGYPYSGWINPQPNGKADIILIGDSHARHYAKGLDEVIAKPLNKSIFISSVSCLMLPGMTRITPGIDWDSLCQNNLNKALSIIRSSPKNSTIIISHSWDAQLARAGVVGSKELLENGDKVKGYRFISSKLKELSVASDGRKLIVIGNVPGAGMQDIAGCFSRPKFFPINCNTKTITPQKDLSTKLGNEILRDEVSKIPNALYLDPQDALCEKGKCRSVINGSFLYSDAAHLSKSGSIIVIRQLSKPLTEELNKEI